MGNHCHWIDKIEIATLVVTPPAKEGGNFRKLSP